jgi:hypothetical protein
LHSKQLEGEQKLHSKEAKSHWIAVTAGFLPVNFEFAADRVEQDLVGLYSFEKILKFTSNDLAKCAPKTLAKYSRYLKEDVPGYGYYSWKPEIVYRAISGEFGACDGVVWIDGGCEILNTPWTRRKFRKRIALAEQTGYSVFELDTPENRFSKRDVIETLNPVAKTDTTPQVQATHFFLYGEVGREIAKTWFVAGLRGIQMFDHSPSLQGDPEEFVLHKSDQSLLSLSLKSLGAAERMVPPPAGNRGLLSRLSAARAPIWVSRNRNGKSLKGPLLRLVEHVTK